MLNVKLKLALSLLVTRILANDPHGTFTLNDLALNANLLYRRSHFHDDTISPFK